MLSISSSHRDVVVFARHQACDRRSSSTRLHIPTVHHVAHLYFNFSSEIGLSSICGWPHGVTMSWHRVQVASPVSVRLSLNWTSGKKRLIFIEYNKQFSSRYLLFSIYDQPQWTQHYFRFYIVNLLDEWHLPFALSLHCMHGVRLWLDMASTHDCARQCPRREMKRKHE